MQKPAGFLAGVNYALHEQIVVLTCSYECKGFSSVLLEKDRHRQKTVLKNEVRQDQDNFSIIVDKAIRDFEVRIWG